jgi:hypothetical protein
MLLVCPRDNGAACAGTLTLQGRLATRGASRRKLTTIAKTSFDIQPGQVAAVRLHLSRAATAALKKARRLAITARLTVAGGRAASATIKLTG